MSAKFRLERTGSDRVRWAVTEISTNEVKQNFRTREEARNYVRNYGASASAVTALAKVVEGMKV